MTDIKAQVDTVKLGDGDVLVIKADHPITFNQHERLLEIGRALIDRLGVKAEVIVLDAGLSVGLLKTSQLPGEATAGNKKAIAYE